MEVVSCACGCGVQFIGSPGEVWSNECLVRDDWYRFMPVYSFGLEVDNPEPTS